ncbi:MAG: hypothetical protein EPN43_04215 [Jatrophihabitans sp.]|nr:MAG: hypothetical protein EPN43_04215 [Jatrophihabitans sp.]
MRDEPIIAPSARKHGIRDEDLLHAYRNAVCEARDDDGVTMLVGADGAGNLLEVGFVVGELGPVIIHARKPARPRFLRG